MDAHGKKHNNLRMEQQQKQPLTRTMEQWRIKMDQSQLPSWYKWCRWPVEHVTWRRLIVSSQNFTIYISSDYVVRQTIIHIIIIKSNNWFWIPCYARSICSETNLALNGWPSNLPTQSPMKVHQKVWTTDHYPTVSPPCHAVCMAWNKQCHGDSFVNNGLSITFYLCRSASIGF